VADVADRVLVFAPVGRDGPLTAEFLTRESIAVLLCPTLADLRNALAEGAGALLMTEEALEDPAFHDLVHTLDQQAAWSDIPIVLFAGTERTGASFETLSVVDTLRNVTLMERPARRAAVVSVVHAALRARRRQYETRDVLMALHAARSDAEAANRLKDEFLATLSHELRTPLNAILGWTAMLRRGQLEPERAARALDVVERNARVQAKLIEDVLDMARIVTGKLRLETTPVTVAPVIEAAIESVRPAAVAKQLKITFDAVAAGTLVWGDAARLQQIFWNLLSNAVKFTPAGGDVQVKVGMSRSYVVVTVTDSGVGLASEFMPFVFDRFRQADQSVTRGHGGLGLGLSIVRHLTELHGGWVEARSEGLGQGSSFSVALPVPAIAPAPDQVSAQSRQPAVPATPLTDRTVLVVDDDASTRELLAQVIGREGARVETASSAAAAIDALRRQPYDVLIADIGMPGEDGNSLVRRVRALPDAVGRIPAIALSAYTRVEDREAARRAGFTTFIGKPTTPEELLHAVRSLVRESPSDRT
jgi:signal transduction histidine kinase/CheY-like chemotaxis protein